MPHCVSSLQEDCSHALCSIDWKTCCCFSIWESGFLRCSENDFQSNYMHWGWYFICVSRLVPLAKCDSFPSLTCALALLKYSLKNIISASSCALDLGALQISLKAVWEDNCWDEALNLHGHKCPETLKSGLKQLVCRYKILWPLCFNISFKWQLFWRQSVSQCHSGKLNSVLSLHKERGELLAASSLYEPGICIVA